MAKQTKKATKIEEPITPEEKFIYKYKIKLWWLFLLHDCVKPAVELLRLYLQKYEEDPWKKLDEVKPKDGQHIRCYLTFNDEIKEKIWSSSWNDLPWDGWYWHSLPEKPNRKN